MSNRFFTRFTAAALIAVAGAAMIATSFDAEAKRIGGGSSAGRQSSNVTTQRQATTPPTAASNTAGATSAAAPAAGAAAGAAAAGARTGASRWLGPIAGIAAGLGIAALLSHMGLGGAFAEMLSSMLLIGLVIFAVLFIVRRLRGAAPRPAMQGAYGMNRDNGASDEKTPAWRDAILPPKAAEAAPVATQSAFQSAQQQAVPGNTSVGGQGNAQVADQGSDWIIPGDFDTPRFLQQAKDQFKRIQGIWDSGDTDRLREFLTDDLITELKPQMLERKSEPTKTEVVLLNAELLGIESVSDGHLASVRFSGMLREAPGTEAFRFEEVWNLFKPAQGGWLLAGIQQIPVEFAS
ncbi:Tim44 domain-containing protein [Bordetella sp. LUAb4]|uniref:Tim44 domain-containing protein n=1 Tax=Bordetella sp. LUAb4 TaxID=2843195 RepID=UPI001E312056|nr:TIM44-like domain-containing protein [Bordetella sp. LUAb4]